MGVRRSKQRPGQTTCILGIASLAACVTTPRQEGGALSGGTGVVSLSAGDPSTAPGDAGTADDGPGSEGAEGMVDGDEAGDDGIKLDVASGMDQADDGSNGEGCDKVDFLFVVDNSGSMEDEQVNLVASFDGFITTIQQTLMAQDYHIMVVDTDAESLSFSGLTCTNNVCSCTPEPQCCFALCANDGPIQVTPPPTECGGVPCGDFELPTGCPVTLGAGKAEDPLGVACGIQDGARFMTDTQPDLSNTFECAALVGAGGDGNERPMEAITNAVTVESAAGGCQEGFLRDDAILVVTFITDEEDEGSVGDAAAWHDTLVAAKGGNEEAVVVLGLLGDTAVPGGGCAEGQSDDAPVLRGFAESFTHGQWGSVCAPSYNAFFEQAVSVIDTSCTDFDPEG